MVEFLNHSIHAALFDLDGVIFDTEPQYTVFWQNIFDEYYPESVGMADKIKGQTLVQIFDKYFPGMTADQEMITARLNEYEQRMHFEYIPGCMDFIRYLRNSSVKTAVVTSSNQAKMQNVYREHPELNSLFDSILTSEDFTRSKPDPDCYLKGAERLHVPTGHSLGFEDSFNGLRSVRSAGMHVVGLATTNSSEAIAPFCDLVINDYTELRANGARLDAK